jgi:hypothetical protein
MPTKTSFVTEQHLRTTPLPQHGGKYSVISHGTIIDTVRKELSNGNFTIDKELYKTTLDGQVAQGIYHLNYNDGGDADMGLMFAWSNSYNKTMKFKCAIGGHVFVCDNGMVSGDLSNFQRKHLGKTAFNDMVSSIQYQISHANVYYTNLVADKEMLKQVNLTQAQKGSVIGRLLIEQDVLTLTQVGMIHRQIEIPAYTYSNNPDSAWDLYNHITLALKDSHPMTYLSDHQKVHNFFVNEFGQLQDLNEPTDNGDDGTPVVYQSEELVMMEEEPTVKEFGVSFN